MHSRRWNCPRDVSDWQKRQRCSWTNSFLAAAFTSSRVLKWMPRQAPAVLWVVSAQDHNLSIAALEPETHPDVLCNEILGKGRLDALPADLALLFASLSSLSGRSS